MPPETIVPEDLVHTPPRFRSLPDYLRIFLRRRLTFLGIFLIIVPLTALYTFTRLPRYLATAQLLIERHLPRVLDSHQPLASDATGQEFYQTQYKLLDSWALTQRVIEKLDLTDHPDFARRFEKAAAPGEASNRKALADLMAWLQSGLTVTPIRNSSLVNVSFSHPDPEFAARAADAFAQAYIEMSLDLRFAASQEAAAWLQQKLLDARKKLADSEAKLNTYKKTHNIVAAEDKETITVQKLEQLNRELVASQTRRLGAESRFKEVRQGHSVKEIQESVLIQTLKAEEARTLKQLSELGKKYGEKHPRMVQLRQELAATVSKIATETNHIAQTIKNEYHIAKSLEDSLRAALQAAKSETQDLSERVIDYRVLLRDVETNRALYENILKSLKETITTENLPAINIRVVHPAPVPSVPVSPRKTRSLIMASFLALILGAILTVVVENLDTTLKTPEEVESWLNLPNLAVIPHLEFGGARAPEDIPELVGHHAADPVAAEAFRSLRTSILFSAPGRAPRTLLLTSALPMEGKTLAAANLAAIMAKTDPKVVLVDADLRRPSLHRIFGVDQEPGLSNFLVGEINELPILSTPVPHLFLVPGGRLPPNPSELLHSARMQEFLTLTLVRFSRILLDSPPLLSFTDAAILATLTEGTLLVLKAAAVPRQAAREARDHLLEVRARLLGALLNDVPVRRLSSYYDHYYRYHRYHFPVPEGFSPHERPASEASPDMRRWVRDRANDYLNKINSLFP